MKKFDFKKLIGLLTALVMAVTLGAANVSAAGAKLSKTSLQLAKGASSTLKVTGTSSVISWTSADAMVASVSAKGVVTGVDEGTTYIYAGADGHTLKCKVTVSKAVISVAKSVTVEAGKSVSVSVTANGADDLLVKSLRSSIATAAWKGTPSNGKYTITLKGISEGKTTVKIYSKSEPKKVTKTFEVVVTKAKAASDKDTDSFAEDTIADVNSIRDSYNYGSLSANEKLSKAATAYAKKLARGVDESLIRAKTLCSDQGFNSKTIDSVSFACETKSIDISDLKLSSALLNDVSTEIGAGYCYSDDAGIYYCVIIVS